MNSLDIAALRAKNCGVNSRVENFYAAWRTCFVATTILHDENGGPSERLLQAVWQHQRLQRDQLTTTDGKPVRILSAPRLGLLVARTRWIRRLHFAARCVEISRPATRKSSATAAGAGSALAGRWKTGFKN